MKKQKSPALNAGANSTQRVELKLDWCSHEAAKYAVEHWHYSESMPTPPVVKIGVWEAGKFIGCVLFSRGACAALGKPYGLKQTETCELTRVALSSHKTPVSRIVAIAIKFLQKRCQGIRLIVSFADANEGHHGGIYQAGNWIYTGKSSPSYKYVDKSGREWHSRQVSMDGVQRQYGEVRPAVKYSDCTKVLQQGKHRYLMPLDDDMRRAVSALAKPYPKHAPKAVECAAPGDQPGEGGANPTSAL